MIRSGWMISALLLLPNIVWFAWPGPSTPKTADANGPVWLAGARLIEAGLRLVVLAMPMFLSVDLVQAPARPALVVAVLGLALYYAAWTRYFVGGRAAHLLFEAWRGIPLPLAVAPTVYVLAASVLTRSVLLAIAAVAFGVIHIFLSAVQARSA